MLRYAFIQIVLPSHTSKMASSIAIHQRRGHQEQGAVWYGRSLLICIIPNWGKGSFIENGESPVSKVQGVKLILQCLASVK